jgi:hypothetical protein
MKSPLVLATDFSSKGCGEFFGDFPAWFKVAVIWVTNTDPGRASSGNGVGGLKAD